MVVQADTVYTPYATVAPLVRSLPTWVPEPDQHRLAAYDVYDQIYWSEPRIFKLQQRGAALYPIYVPNARTVVDTTSHYMLKGLKITVGDPDEYSEEAKDSLSGFLKREAFYSKFHTAKHSGVARGDFVMHLTADSTKQSGTRISITDVHPCKYFPVWDEDDDEKLLRVHLATQYIDSTKPNDQKRIRRLTYEYVVVDGQRRVSRKEGIFVLNDKWWGPTPELLRWTIPESLLPLPIQTIPVYHYKNMGWQGESFGASELRGFERLLSGVNQTISDQELALALDGLGVYSTDAGRPVNDQGEEEDWEIAPGRVMEVPNGAYFRRVEGLQSVTPSLDHVTYLESALFQASGTSEVARGQIDVQTAESGIALAIKFMPTLAKLEQRDTEGIDVTTQLFFDWQFWLKAYEGEDFAKDIEVSIGAKLPDDRVAKLNELNNMFDRQLISVEFYRAEMTKLGYKFPADMDEQIAERVKMKAEAQAEAMAALPGNDPTQAGAGKPIPEGGLAPGGKPANRSNNAAKPNESAGTEAR